MELQSFVRQRAARAGASGESDGNAGTAAQSTTDGPGGGDSRGWRCRRAHSFPALTPEERRLMRSPSIGRRGDGGARREQADRAEVTRSVRRAASLKTGGTPEKKIVRFADLLGLELLDVRHFLDGALPKVPKSAFRDLKDVEPPSDLDSNSSTTSSPFPTSASSSSKCLLGAPSGAKAVFSYPTTQAPTTALVPMFAQPGSLPHFFDLVQERKICLESAFMAADACSVKGTIRLRNLGFLKRVTVLFTTTDWMQQSETEAKYMDGSCDGFSDKFTFHLVLSSALLVGKRLQFCLRYEVNGQTYWDNNTGKNYSFQCICSSSSSHLMASSMGTSSDPRPIHSCHHRSVASAPSLCYSPSSMALDPWHRFQA